MDSDDQSYDFCNTPKSKSDIPVASTSEILSIPPLQTEPKANKVSKKNKRIEKENQKIRDEKISELKELIENNKVKFYLLTTVYNKFFFIFIKSINEKEVNHEEMPKSSIGLQSCNTCGGEFHSTQEFRNHFKYGKKFFHSMIKIILKLLFRSEWHRYNLTRKMKNLPAITTEEEFLASAVKDLSIN
jgi:hypothetical protein